MKEKMTKRDIFSNCSYLDVNHFLMETFTGVLIKQHYRKPLKRVNAALLICPAVFQIN